MPPAVLFAGAKLCRQAKVLGLLFRADANVDHRAVDPAHDNALITYLSILVPSLSSEVTLAVVQGGGGGLTVIANAPNAAGQGLLGQLVDVRFSGLLAGAAASTMIVAMVCRLLRGRR